MPSIALLARAADEPSGHPVVPRFLGLLEDGWNAHLVLLGAGAARLKCELPAETLPRVHAQPALAGRARRRLGRPRTASTDGWAGSLLGALDAELVHVPSAGIAADVLVAANGLPARVVVGMLAEDLGGSAVCEPERLAPLWDRADAVHVESEALAELAGWLGAPESKAVVVPPVAAHDGTALRRAGESRRHADGLRILSFGPLTWAQGYEHALMAIRRLREAGMACRYRIVGHGDYADAVAFARYQLELEDVVEIVGGDRLQALGEHLAWADVLLNTAVVPTSPIAVLAAQAGGVPVVTTEPPLGGAEAALLVPRRDAHAAADALAQLARDAVVRARLADEGRRAASAVPGLSAQVDRFRGLYRAVLAGGVS